MKRWILSLAVVALPGFCEERTALPPIPSNTIIVHTLTATPPPIALYTHFDQEPGAEVESALRDELAAIMEPMGMTFEWRSLDRRSDSEVAVELAVINFKGRCESTGLPSVTEPGNALGWTHVSDGVILPFSDIDCNRIHTFVHRELAHRAPEEREIVLGRAMARVLAHELYHIFANTSRHGSCGVGKSAYTVQELLSDKFKFDTKESDALRISKNRVAVEGAGFEATDSNRKGTTP